MRSIISSNTNLLAAFPGSQVILLLAIGHRDDGAMT